MHVVKFKYEINVSTLKKKIYKNSTYYTVVVFQIS